MLWNGMKILFCDWNGTLLNDTPIWEQAIAALFAHFGKRPPTAAEWFTLLEQTGDYMDAYRALGITASREELNALYEKEYTKISANAELFPDVVETLAELKRRGVVISLVTMQPAAIAHPALKHFDIEKFFTYLDFHVLNKAPAISRVIINELVLPHECYFIGDAPSDMRHAKKAGVQAVAFLNEHIPHELLHRTEPHHCVRSFSEILQFL